MILTEIWQRVLFGILGGFAAEVLHWYMLSRQPGGVEGYKTGPIYWGATLLMILFGGLMPLMYVSSTASALLCFHLGIATPVTLQKLLGTIPQVAAGQGATRGPGDSRGLHVTTGANNTSILKFFKW